MFKFDVNQPAAKPMAERSGDSMRSVSSQNDDSLGANILSVALIGPDEPRRMAFAHVLPGPQVGVIKEFDRYPDRDEVPELMAQRYDVAIVDLDSNPEYALELVESLCENGCATVMVYSSRSDSDLMLRCMRAGAREFLTLPFSPDVLAEALVRAVVRRSGIVPPKKTEGKVLVFFGVKGGSGVTTLASNFAVLLARESEKSTLLIDLDLPLGDVALSLGINAQYSAVDALQNASRLDATFLSTLLYNYRPGLSVLAAPGEFTRMEASHEAIDKLMTVARQKFDYVVVDSGSRFDLTGTALIEEAATVYLVTQVGLPELRNSNRLISEFFTGETPNLEIILNRYVSSMLGVDEEHITKALTRPVRWRVPNDTTTVRKVQSTATPLALGNSAISRVLCQMARTACGLPAVPKKKKNLLGLFK